MFRGYECFDCGTRFSLVLPALRLCRGCALRSKCAKHALALRPARMCQEVIEIVTEFLVPDYAAAGKLHFLKYKVLLAPGSPFRQLCLMFSSSILKRILAFLDRNILLRGQRIRVQHIRVD